jgi:4-amino-4-deoxy-L-arabinose transferase-like glycosyltransferase
MKKIHIGKDGWIIIGLFLLTLAIRLIFKNDGLFHWDSLKDVMVIEEILKTGEMQYSYAYGAPGMVALVFLFYWISNLLFGSTSAEPAYFFVTFLTTCLSVVLLYILTKKVTKSRFASIAASLFFSFNAIFLTVTTYPKTHSIALFFILLSFYFIFLYNKHRKSYFIWLSGILFGLSVSVRILNVLLILPLLYIYLNPIIKNKSIRLRKSKLKIRNFLYFFIGSFGVWYLLFAKRISEWGGFIPYLSRLLGEQGSAVRWQGIISSSLDYSISQLYISISLIGSALFFIGLYYGIKKYKKTTIFLLLWLIPPFLYFANIDQPLSRFFIV